MEDNKPENGQDEDSLADCVENSDSETVAARKGFLPKRFVVILIIVFFALMAIFIVKYLHKPTPKSFASTGSASSLVQHNIAVKNINLEKKTNSLNNFNPDNYALRSDTKMIGAEIAKINGQLNNSNQRITDIKIALNKISSQTQLSKKNKQQMTTQSTILQSLQESKANQKSNIIELRNDLKTLKDKLAENIIKQKKVEVKVQNKKAKGATLNFKVMGYDILAINNVCEVIVKDKMDYRELAVNQSYQGWSLVSADCHNKVAVFSNGHKQIVVGG